MSNKTVLLYAISGLCLLALADFYPRMAMLFVGVLILGVVVQNGNTYSQLLNTVSGGK